jgi:hypothetical protein
MAQAVERGQDPLEQARKVRGKCAELIREAQAQIRTITGSGAAATERAEALRAAVKSVVDFWMEPPADMPAQEQASRLEGGRGAADQKLQALVAEAGSEGYGAAEAAAQALKKLFEAMDRQPRDAEGVKQAWAQVGVALDQFAK